MRFADGESYEGKITAVDEGPSGAKAAAANKRSKAPLQPWWEGITLRWDTGEMVSCLSQKTWRGEGGLTGKGEGGSKTVLCKYCFKSRGIVGFVFFRSCVRTT